MSVLIYEWVVSVKKIHKKLSWNVWKRNMRDLWRSDVVIILKDDIIKLTQRQKSAES